MPPRFNTNHKTNHKKLVGRYMHEIEDAMHHPDWCGGRVGCKGCSWKKGCNQPVDIGLIKLKNKLKWSKHVGPVCLPQKPAELNNQQVYVAGWGLTEKEMKYCYTDNRTDFILYHDIRAGQNSLF